MSQHTVSSSHHFPPPWGFKTWWGLVGMASVLLLGLAVVTAPLEAWMKAVLALAGLLMILLFGLYEMTATADVRSFGNLMWMLTVVLAGVAATAFLARGNQIFIVKLFAIVALAVLPGWLYFQFVRVRGRTLWDEYVLSLYRLKAASSEYLPAPPKHSRYYDEDLHGDAAEDASKLLRQKFESVYGEIVVGEGSGAEGDDRGHVRGETFRPVLFATLLLVVAWSLVLQPDPYGNLEFLPDLTAVNLVDLPVDALRFGFLGAYLFTLQMLMRRYFQNDLKAAAYISVIVRIISVALIVLVLQEVLPADLVNSGSALAVAFVVGMFPYIGIQAIRVFVSNRLRTLVPSLQSKYPLSDLDGLDVWYEARLLEEGIEDMQNLSTANLVDLLLHTRVPLERLVDWVDQAHLYLRVEGAQRERCSRWWRRRKDEPPQGDSDRDKLRKLGIRSATDLQDAFAKPRRHPGMTQQEYDEALREHKRCVKRLAMVLNTEEQKDWPGRLTMILKTLEGEPNLVHVRSWKQSVTGKGRWSKKHSGAGSAGSTKQGAPAP